LPPPQREVPARGQELRLIAGLAAHRDEPAVGQRAAVLLDHQPGLALADDDEAEEQGDRNRAREGDADQGDGIEDVHRWLLYSNRRTPRRAPGVLGQARVARQPHRAGSVVKYGFGIMMRPWSTSLRRACCRGGCATRCAISA